MDRAHVTQQTTSSTISLHSELAHDAPTPRALRRGTFQGPLQWALEGQGWGVVRPIGDFVMVCLALVVALGGVSLVVHVNTSRAPLLLFPFLVVLLFYLRGLYKTKLRTQLLDGIVPVISGVSVAAMMVAVLGLALNHEVPEQGMWARAWFYALLGVGAGRTVLALAQRRARARRLVGKPVLIMGAGVVGAQVARRLENHPEYGLAPVGFLDEDPRSVAEVGGREVPVLGTIDDLEEAVSRTGVKNLIVAFSSVADARVSRLIPRCQELGVDVSVVPRMFDLINDRVGYDTVGGLPLLSFRAVDPKGMQFAIKHALDRVLALALLILFSPVIALAAFAVKLSSPGPVLFKQRRVGRDGRVFDFYKFRSMREPSISGELDDEGGGALDFLLAGDVAPGGVEGEDRRTAIGRLLRSTSLDELPQLFNVLRGDMSLVGPRPERPEFVELFRNDIIRYGDRHRVRSGITGWAQVHGLRGQTSLAERVEWDNYYIAHWSLGLDLKILALTLVALFRNAE
ncbi:MAG TPA: exopolysaccharide biosynthesis polyprenyl glycosylphosphotransferase [Solirubrobacteraceae bacterium]|jgi:exopolysaccharide biosynthesis polyprenyl glycosylphosphotransferase|nr:exopolysaccharide biosynthesis polyprenyl glycosylphosphotransferase [Solirubrobacteraceae bacterium]